MIAIDADRERWAEALLVERQHGSRAPAFIAERVAAMALAAIRWALRGGKRSQFD